MTTKVKKHCHSSTDNREQQKRIKKRKYSNHRRTHSKRGASRKPCIGLDRAEQLQCPKDL